MEQNTNGAQIDAGVPALEEFAGWRKSHTSDDGACVYIADGPNGWLALRDSADPGEAVVRIPRKSWDAFVDGIVSGALKPADV